MVLEADKKTLTIYTPSNPQGEIINDLPEGGVFLPAVLNKSAKADRNIKILVRFDFTNA